MRGKRIPLEESWLQQGPMVCSQIEKRLGPVRMPLRRRALSLKSGQPRGSKYPVASANRATRSRTICTPEAARRCSHCDRNSK